MGLEVGHHWELGHRDNKASLDISFQDITRDLQGYTRASSWLYWASGLHRASAGLDISDLKDHAHFEGEEDQGDLGIKRTIWREKRTIWREKTTIWRKMEKRTIWRETRGPTI